MPKHITQDELKRWLDYDPETGIFRYTGAWDGKKGEIAGNIDRSDGRRKINIGGGAYRAARLAFLWMTGALPKHHVDHINRNRADDRWANLRDVTHAENNRNMPKKSSNRSGVNGVAIGGDYPDGKWQYMAYTPLDKQCGGKSPICCGHDLEKAKQIRAEYELKHGFHPSHGKAPHELAQQTSRGEGAPCL